MDKKFTKYLIENGFIDKRTGNEILSLYAKKSFKFENLNNLYFNETMTEILLSIFNNLSEIQIKYLCFHLPAKFIKISKKQIKDKLKNILNKAIIKKKLILSKYLFKWYRNINKPIKNILIDKNIFRQSNKTNINTNNKNKYYINESIKDFLFNNDNDNIFIKNYQSNLSTLNNDIKIKTLQNTIKKNPTKTPKKIKFLYNKDVFNIKDIKYISNNITNDRSIITSKTTNNKELFSSNNNYINQMKKDYKINYKKNSNNDTITSGLRDYSNESNENCISTNLDTINNRCNNNQDNKTLSHSEYIQNFDLLNNYNIKTYKKITNNIPASNQKMKEYNNNFHHQRKSVKKDKIKNKSNLIQNILNEDFDINYSISPITNSKSKKSNNNSNIYNLIYCNNYNNLNPNKAIYDDYTLYNCNYQTPFCQTMKNSKSSKEHSACRRLFEEGKKRKKIQDQKMKEQEKFLDEMASRISGEKKNVDFERINYLYKSKERSNTYEKVKNKVEKEEGLTFKPMINKSEYSKRIYGNFMERNCSSKSKDRFINEYNFTNNNINNNTNYRKKFTKKQKEKIVKGVINRLYSNSLIKSMSTCCNKYTKGINYNNLKPYKKKLQE